MLQALELPLTLEGGSTASALELPLLLGGSVTAATRRISASTNAQNTTTRIISLCHRDSNIAVRISQDTRANFGVTLGVVRHFEINNTLLPRLNNSKEINYTIAELIKNCSKMELPSVALLSEHKQVNYSESFDLESSAEAKYCATKQLRTCAAETVTPAAYIETQSHEMTTPAVIVKECKQVNYSRAVYPACQWFVIPLPPDPDKPIEQPCGLPPSSLSLPLQLTSIEQANALMLPLRLACGFDKPETPILGAYIVYNEMTATLDNQHVDLLSVKISTSMDSFCWQLSADITHADFVKFNLAKRADKPILSVTINGYRWDVMIYPNSENQAFINNRASINGESITSQLVGGDVMRDPEIITTTLNARQIIDKQLHLLPISLSDYDATDWLVPGGTYTQVGAPMDTIIDIAKSGGNYVESHRYNPTFKVKKRWPKKAWEVKDAFADITLPDTVAETIDATHQDNMCYNSVYVIGNSANAAGAPVIRQLSNGKPEASSLTHQLYTDVAVLREAGIAALSDSGRHALHSLKTFLSDKYNVPLLGLGKVLQLNQSSGGNIKGVVKAIEIDADVNNDVLKVDQLLKVDVYNDV